MTEMQRVRKLLSRLCTSRLFPVALLGVTCVIALVWGFLELKPVRVYDGVTDTTVYTSSAQPNIVLGKAGILPGENDLVDTRHTVSYTHLVLLMASTKARPYPCPRRSGTTATAERSACPSLSPAVMAQPTG